MPLVQLRESDGPIETQLSGSSEWIEYDKLQLGSAHVDKYVKGTISVKYSPHELGTGEKVLKIVLEESTLQPSTASQASINTFIFGKLVGDCDSILKQGDAVVLRNFQVTESSSASQDGRHAFQLELSDEAGATVFSLFMAELRRSSLQCFGLPAEGAIYALRPQWEECYALVLDFDSELPQVCSKTEQESAPIIQKPKVGSHDYSYTPLNMIKDGVTVNVYGVVKFFKPPYRTKGTDYCSTVTIVDHSEGKLNCVIFNGNPDLLPKIYKVGDVVRFHRVKIQEFNHELQAISTPGFSALTFDGTVGASINPRTSSKTYNFTSTDQQKVEELRRWTNANISLLKTAIKLSEVKPAEYFDLTCQLVAKAVVDRSAVMLKVWDGTKCPHPLRPVPVARGALEGDLSEIRGLSQMTVDVLVYDNHISVANSLKLGAYLKIHNVHAKLTAASAEKQNESLDGGPEMEFHLHGGTSYGRGIVVLPADCSDTQRLKQSLESALPSNQDSMGELAQMEILNSSSGPSACQEFSPDCVERCHQESATVLTAHQHISTTSLREVLDKAAPCKHRIRAKLVNYEPRALYQSVKLYCPKCRTLQEIPDDDDINALLQDACCAGASPGSQLHDAAWYETTIWEQGDQRRHQIIVRFVKTNRLHRTPERCTILVERVTLNELYHFSEKFGNVIPSTSSTDHLILNDLSVPFLIQDGKWHYGCKQCSHPQPVSALQSLTHSDSWELPAIAKVLGIQRLHYVFVLKFTLDDGTGSLDAFLWDEAERFFGIPAADIVISEVLQEKLTRIMSTLCPPKTDPEGSPWLECCLKSYYVGEGSEEKTCYQVFDTTFAGFEGI